MRLITIYLMSGFAGIGIGIVGPLIPLLLAGSGASGGQVGLAATIMFAGLGSAAFAAGQLTDTYGPKAGIVGGAVIYAIALAALPAVDSFGAFLALRALEGIGIGILVVSLEAAINLIVAAQRRGRAMGTYSLVFAAGVAAGPAIGVYFQSSVALPFRIASLATAAAGIFMLFAFRNIIPENKGAPPLYAGLLGVLWGPIAAALLYALVEVTLLSLYPLYLTNLGLEAKGVSLVYSIYASGAVISPLVAGVVSDKLKRESVMVIAGVLLVIGIASVWLSATAGWIAITTGVMGLASGAIYPLGLSMIGDRTPVQQLGAANSLFTCAYSAGSILGPFSAGVLIDAYGPRVLFAPLVAVAVGFLALAVADALRQYRLVPAYRGKPLS
jgi:MFS family permease